MLNLIAFQLTKARKEWIKRIPAGKDFNMPKGKGTYGSKVGRPKKKKGRKKSSKKSRRY